jgi:hypothetical protein
MAREGGKPTERGTGRGSALAAGSECKMLRKPNKNRPASHPLPTRTTPHILSHIAAVFLRLLDPKDEAI